jgi:hypothetical protein
VQRASIKAVRAPIDRPFVHPVHARRGAGGRTRATPSHAVLDPTVDHAPMTTQRLGWLAAIGMSLIVLVGACIPSGAAIPSGSASGQSTATVVAPSASPSPSGPSAKPSFTYPTPTPLPTFLVYMVRPGDTLTSIAREQGTTARSIAFWNRQRYPSLDPDSPKYSPNRIEVGWELLLVPNVELDPEDVPEPSPSDSASPATSASGSG